MGWTPDKGIDNYVAEADYTAAYSVLVTQATLGVPENLALAASTLLGRKATGGIAALTGAEVATIMGLSLDAAYNGGSTVTVDAYDVIWNTSGAYSFTVDISSGSTGTGDGFHVEEGTDYFRLNHSAAGEIAWTADLGEVTVAASKGATFDFNNGFSIDGSGSASNLSSTSDNLTLSTVTSGTLFVTSAGTLDMDGVAVTLDASGGFSIDGAGAACNVSATSQDLTVSTITAGTLALTSAALLTLSDGYKAGSSYATDLVLSDSIAEWSAFDTAFGEVSVLSAITALKDGNAATVTVADTTDTTCYVGLFEDATGSLAAKTDGALTYNASTGALSATRMGVGSTTAPTDTLNVSASATGGIAVVGPTELLTNGTFDSDLSGWTAGANWAWGAGGTADHSAGGVETLTQTIATTSGQHYQVTVVLSAVSASNVVMTLTSSSGSETFTLSSATTYTYSFKAGAASSTLTFTPNTAFVGSITSVSFKLITPASAYTFATMDSGGARSGLCSVATDDALQNLFAGVGSGVLNTTGSSNSAMGWSALAANTIGSSNSAMGRSALAANTTGVENSAMGRSALAANTTGNNNSAMGRSALTANTTGINNSAMGRSALGANTTGSSNSAMGAYASCYYGSGTDSLTSATQCVYLGAWSRANANTMTNEIVIGYNAIGAGSNTATLGNTSIAQTVLRGNFGTITGAYGTSAAGVLGLASGTAPTTSPADAVQMWSADFNSAAGKAALHLRDESGVLSVFGNNWGLFTAGGEAIDATAKKTIFLSNGTAPSAHTDDGIYIHSLNCGSYDSADDLASLALCTESAVITASKAQDSALAITINGHPYWMLLRACEVA